MQVQFPLPKRTYRVSGNMVAVAGIAPFLTIHGVAGRVLRVTRIRINAPTLTALQLLRIAVQRFSTLATGGTPVAGTIVKMDTNAPASLAVVRTYAGGAPTAGTLVGQISERTVLAQATVPAAGAPLDEGDFDWTSAEAITEFPTIRGAAEQIGVLFPVAPVSVVTLSYTIEFTEDGN